MKLSIERAALLKSLAHVQNVVERRTTLPILANVRLEAVDNSLNLTATDLELQIVDRGGADIENPGSTTVPAHTLYDIVRKLPDGSLVELATSDDSNHLTIRAARSKFELPCLPADDFPGMSADDFEHNFAIPAGELRRLVDKTRFAISTEETRYYLNGIFVHAVEEGATSCLRGVATDGHRLARFETLLPTGAAGMPPVIVPRKTINELRKLIDDTDVEIAVGLSASRIQFVVGPAVIVSRLIDGTFPDYERVIPSGNDKHMTVDSRLFKEAVDRVATISTEKSRAVKLALAPGRLTISAVSPDAGSAVEEVDATYDQEQLEIGFNARYILDMMEQIEGETIELELANPAAPTLVRDPKDSNTLYVLMPMRV